MKTIITSDIHFGVPNKIAHSIWAVKVIREYAAKHGIEVVLTLGDLFHDRTSINIEVMSAAYSFFEETQQKYDQEWMAFPGNHDLYLKNSWKINSVRPLNKLLTIIEDIKMITLGGTNFWILPFVHYESAYMEVVRAIERKAGPDDILLTHIGVANAKLNECFLLKHWSLVDFSNTKFNRVYSGHFHCYQQVGSNTWYPGSPIPFRFDEGLVEHGFMVYDTDTKTHEFIKTFEVGKLLLPDEEPSPDYLTCTDDDVDKINVDKNHIRVCLSREYTSNELTELRAKIMARGARVVKWMKTKQEEDDDIQLITKSNLADGEKLFEQWLAHDEPNLDRDALLRSNKAVIEEGLERLSTTEEPDGDAQN